MVEEILAKESQDLARLALLFKEQSGRLQKEDWLKIHELKQRLRVTLDSIECVLEHRRPNMQIASVLNDADLKPSSKNESSREAQRPFKIFKRSHFYSAQSPYPHMRDKSGSFRLAPPLPTRDEVLAKRTVHGGGRERSQETTNFLLQNLALLENLQNLKRLGETEN